VEFADRLKEAVCRRGNPVVVGLDPRPEEFPPGLLDGYPGTRQGVAAAIERFGREILEVVAPLVPAVKFQSAYYEAYGPEGLTALEATIRHAKSLGLIVIFDGKRNDIGSTAEAYARAYLGKVPVGGAFEAAWDVDAVTVNPYLGADGVAPFVKIAARDHKGVFLLVRTSNPSAGDLQDLVAGGEPVYRHVARKLLNWTDGHRGTSGYHALGAVVGATYPKQLAELRQLLPGILFLIPGYGSQGANASEIAPAFDPDGFGAIVNNSRGIIFAYTNPRYRDESAGHWTDAVRAAVLEMIEDLAEKTPAGRLRSSK
jgi:orotidine-5'-phosphate decarboxylase